LRKVASNAIHSLRPCPGARRTARAAHLEGFPTADATAQSIGTALQVGLVVALLALSSRLPADRAAAPV